MVHNFFTVIYTARKKKKTRPEKQGQVQNLIGMNFVTTW